MLISGRKKVCMKERVPAPSVSQKCLQSPSAGPETRAYCAHAVRGDLIKILHRLAPKKFDAVLVETTGLADPAPVAQTFFVDDFVKVKWQSVFGCTVLVFSKDCWPKSSSVFRCTIACFL